TEGGSARKAAVEKTVEGLGGTLEAIYYAYGDTDVIVIVDVPDTASALALSLVVNASGAINIKTTPLLTVADMDAACLKTVTYRPAGAAAPDVSVPVLISDTELNTAQDVARAHGVDVVIQPKAQIVDPFTWILIGGGALAAAKFIVDTMDKAKGGCLINLGPNANVRRDKGIPFGWVVILSADGKEVKIEVHDAP